MHREVTEASSRLSRVGGRGPEYLCSPTPLGTAVDSSVDMGCGLCGINFVCFTHWGGIGISHGDLAAAQSNLAGDGTVD